MHVCGKDTDCTRRRETLVQYDIYRRHQKKMPVLWARLLGTPPGSHHAMAPEDPRLSDRRHPSRLRQRYGTCRKRKRNKQGSTYGVPETVCSEAGRAFYVKGAVLVRTGSTLESYGGGAPGKDDGSKPRRGLHSRHSTCNSSRASATREGKRRGRACSEPVGM